MISLQGINSNAYLVNNLTSSAITPAYGLLASELSLSIPALYNNASTLVGISAKGQALSAVSTFQEQMQALKPAATGNFATLAAQAQSLVDSFNTLQHSIADINANAYLPSGGVPGTSPLAQSLNTQTLASYSNGSSTLTQLSNLGITFQPSLQPDGSGTLSLDQGKLQSAFNSDAGGAFSLIAKAANTFGNLAGNFISQSGSQYASIDALIQSSLGYSVFSNNLVPQAQPNSDFLNLLANQSITGSYNSQQVFSALTEYAMVSSLFG